MFRLPTPNRLVLAALGAALLGSVAVSGAADAPPPAAPVQVRAAASPRPCYRGFPGRRQPALGVRCYRPATNTSRDAARDPSIARR